MIIFLVEFLGIAFNFIDCEINGISESLYVVLCNFWSDFLEVDRLDFSWKLLVGRWTVVHFLLVSFLESHVVRLSRECWRTAFGRVVLLCVELESFSLEFLLPFHQLVLLSFEVLLKVRNLAVESFLSLTECYRVFLRVSDLRFNLRLLNLKITFPLPDNKLALIDTLFHFPDLVSFNQDLFIRLHFILKEFILFY